MSLVHVAVAVIVDEANKVLIALRHDHQHQGGLWEFPGGKVNDDETVFQALVREIKEEVALEVLLAVPLLEIKHDYVDKSVLLDVWRVTDYLGQAEGLEGQQLKWCAIEQLTSLDFPQANQTIIELLQSRDYL